MEPIRGLGAHISELLWERFLRLGRAGYNRWRMFRADRAFRRRDRSFPIENAIDDGHVVVVVVDALRADAINSKSTPFLHNLDGVEAIAPTPWTYPSVASMMTGRYPHQHGAMRQNDELMTGGGDGSLPPALPEKEMTLPELLDGAGFDTFGAFGFTVPFLALEGRFEAHRLFDRVQATTVFDAYDDWWTDVSGDRTFAYLHLFELHGPFPRHPTRAILEKA